MTDFEPPHGTFLVLTENGETVAGGALRRRDPDTAEVKRVWTANRHRRRGLARRVLTELERAAVDLGYRSIYLTTGPRQPEARSLYLSSGYVPQFDLDADPETIGPLPFVKALPVPRCRLSGCMRPLRPPQDRGRGWASCDDRPVRGGLRRWWAADGVADRATRGQCRRTAPGRSGRRDPRRRPVSRRRWPDLAATAVEVAVDELDGRRRHDLHRRIGDLCRTDRHRAVVGRMARRCRPGRARRRRTRTPRWNDRSGRLPAAGGTGELPGLGVPASSRGAPRTNPGDGAPGSGSPGPGSPGRAAARRPTRRCPGRRGRGGAGPGLPRPPADAGRGEPRRAQRRRRPDLHSTRVHR